MATKPLLVIIGPTASGKSAFALRLAKQFNGEIICADSRTVYRGMDIGTAKPSLDDRAAVPHHLLDIVDPDELFTAARFKVLASQALEDIHNRGKLPIIVGGTGLYIDGLIFDYAFLPPGPSSDREALQKLDVAQLQKLLIADKIPLPENFKNPRHLIRALETNGAVAVKKGVRKNTRILGLGYNKEGLEEKIIQRVKLMIKQGLEMEVKQLAKTYGWEAPGLSAVGYREWFLYFVQKQNFEQTLQLIQQHSLQYAKRQRTWFRRNQHVAWLKSNAEGIRMVKTFLQQKQP